jgi:hypothetical protein
LTNASVTGDIFEVFAAQPVAISDVYTQTQANAAFINDSLLDAKGDIVTATANDAAGRLGVGTNGQILTADSAETTGLKWTAAPSGYIAPTIGTTTITSGTTVSTLTSVALDNASLTGTVTAGGSAGTSGYVLSTTGTGVQWAAVAGSLAQPTEPTSPTDGQIWVDTDGTALINQLLRWSESPANGTTTLSGNDDNGLPLTYSVGYEQVFQNGALLARGSDYTATNGTSISLTNASVTGDIFEVFAAQPVAISDVYTQTQVNAAFIPDSLIDAKGDIVTATAADTPARLAVGTNTAPLVADSTQSTGLKWDYDSWASYTPSAINLTVGNGTLEGKYKQIGRVMHVYTFFTLGSTSAIGNDAGFGYPVAGVGNSRQGSAWYYDASTATYYNGWWSQSGYFRYQGVYGVVNATTPFTWATSDVISTYMTYEVF